MTNLATKNGSLIVKNGSIAENCGCCGGGCSQAVLDTIPQVNAAWNVSGVSGAVWPNDGYRSTRAKRIFTSSGPKKARVDTVTENGAWSNKTGSVELMPGSLSYIVPGNLIYHSPAGQTNGNRYGTASVSTNTTKIGRAHV